MTRLVAGRLLLLDAVGTGGSGTARRAWDVRGRRQVVVKPGGSDLPHVDHPHVLPEERIGSLAVTPLVRGGSVEQLLAGRGALPAALTAVLLDQLLDALEAVHDAGWVHRDVKPGNLLLEPLDSGPPHLWLADLGSARRAGEHGPPDGTPGYVAPEARVPGRAAPAHDLYAAGMTAAELLAGRVPSGADELGRSSLRPLLRSLIHPDPARRPTTAAAARALLVR